MRTASGKPVWTVAEAKARLSEIMRLAVEVEPQIIGTRKPCVVIPIDVWERELKNPRRVHLGRWLLENAPRGTNLDVPTRSGALRPIPFIDDEKQ